MSRRRLLVFATLTVAITVLVAMSGLLAADLYLHHRAERSAGLNRWGYRGPVLGRKQPGEVRIAMLGGSTMFGYGVSWGESLPAVLEQLLPHSSAAPIRTINLGFNNEGAYALVPTMEDFAWLNYDVVCLYSGYNDMSGDAGPNRATYRRASPVFRLTGYFPILPLVLAEKALSLRHGGLGRSVDAKAVFHPTVTARTSATAMESASSVIGTLGNSLDRVTPAAPMTPASAEGGCEAPWIDYCDSMYRAIKYARTRGVRVIVASQPLGIAVDFKARQISQQQALANMVARNFGGDHETMFVDLSRVVDLADPKSSFDQMHLSVDGNRRVAQALVEPTLVMAGVVRSR